MKASMYALTATAASSMLAASLANLTAASAAVPSSEGNSSYVTAKIFGSGSSEKGKVSPRFDGLRFIETLVTAHR